MIQTYYIREIASRAPATFTAEFAKPSRWPTDLTTYCGSCLDQLHGALRMAWEEVPMSGHWTPEHDDSGCLECFDEAFETWLDRRAEGSV